MPPRWNVLQSLWILRRMLISLRCCALARRRQKNLPLMHGFVSSRISGSFIELGLADLVMTNTRVGEEVEKELSAATGLKTPGPWWQSTTGSNSVHLARARHRSWIWIQLAFFVPALMAAALVLFWRSWKPTPQRVSQDCWRFIRNNLGPQRGQVLPQLLQKLPNLVHAWHPGTTSLGMNLAKNWPPLCKAPTSGSRILSSLGEMVSAKQLSKRFKRCVKVEWFTWCDLNWSALGGKIKMVLMQLEGACHATNRS